MSDRVHEPLMSLSHDADDEYENADNQLEEGRPGSEHGDPGVAPTLFVWLLTFSAGISGLLFGCKYSDAFNCLSRVNLCRHSRHRRHLRYPRLYRHLPLLERAYNLPKIPHSSLNLPLCPLRLPHLRPTS